jgi:uncharacterized protein YndB with AHSA1/START domain
MTAARAGGRARTRGAARPAARPAARQAVPGASKGNAAPPAYKPPIGDDAVLARTGRNWNQWFRILDAAGARKMSHPDIARHLHDEERVGPWWSQMVTVVYEQARGLREKHERPEGFSVSVSRTVEVSNAALFRAWRDSRVRSRWLPKEQMTIRKATSGKSMRITWSDGKTDLEVNFTPRGAGRSQVVVQHSKLADAKAAARMKAWWTKTLDRLRDVLEA